MRAILLTLFTFLSIGLHAQETDQTAHIRFEGIEMKGDIYEFSKVLQSQGYKLEKRESGTRAFIFKGNICGHSTLFQVSYSRRTRTVYRIIAQPKNVALDALIDSLNVRYGQPYDTSNNRYMWQVDAGAVMLSTPEGYDPTLVIMDGAGVAAFKDEDHR